MMVVITMLMTGCVSPEPEIVAATPEPSPTATLESTPTPGLWIDDCKSLTGFERVIEGTLDIEIPVFQPIDIGEWDWDWRFDDEHGSYTTMLKVREGCIDHVRFVSVSDVGMKTPELANYALEAIGGYFSPSSNGMEWVAVSTISACEDAFTSKAWVTFTEEMEDSTLWELVCDTEGNVVTLTVTIYPKRW